MPTHNQDLLPATHAYRALVARCAAEGALMPKISHIAFGTGQRPYAPEADADLDKELIRLPAVTTAEGPLLSTRVTLVGSYIGDAVIREVGAFAADGTLVGRRVIKPTELEPYAELDIELTFEY